MAQLQDHYTPFKYVKGTYMQESFGHLDGYSAIYYTYMWSLVIAKDMFTVFKHDGLLSPEAAARYRREVLEPGGSNPQPAGDRLPWPSLRFQGLRRLVERKDVGQN